MRTSTPKTDNGGAPEPEGCRRVHVIVPSAVYTLASAREALGLKAGTLPREIRLRRLRAAKRAGKVFLLGEWLLTWLKEGEVTRRRAAKLNGEHDAGQE
jgi:hypothetical protein